MSDCEQMAQVAHQKWANCSFFLAKRLFAHFWKILAIRSEIKWANSQPCLECTRKVLKVLYLRVSVSFARSNLLPVLPVNLIRKAKTTEHNYKIMRIQGSRYPLLSLITQHMVIIWTISWVEQGIARTQSPTIRNYAFELPTFGVIVGVNPTVVQWSGLTLEEPPSWSRLTSTPGKYASLS